MRAYKSQQMDAYKDKRLDFLQESWATLRRDERALLETIYQADIKDHKKWNDDIEFVGKVRSHNEVKGLLKQENVPNAEYFKLNKMKWELDRRKFLRVETLTLKDDVSSRTMRLHIKLKQPIAASEEEIGRASCR